MPRRDIALDPQLITHPLRHTLLAPATDASHVQLGKSVCPVLRTARPAVCPSMTSAVPRARVINTQAAYCRACGASQAPKPGSSHGR